MRAALMRPFLLRGHGQAKLFLRLFLIASVAFFILWQASLYFDAFLENRQQRTVTLEETRRARDILDETIESFLSDLAIIAKGNNLRRLAAGDDSARGEVAKDFQVFASAKSNVAQIRFIDRQGNETVRVNRRGANIIVVDPANLQNRAKRYYFRESIGLPEGGLYASEIDLNLEHGKIEEPWRPVLRLATPIMAPGKGTTGILVLGIAADGIIAEIDRTRPATSAPIQMLNADGYWIAGAPRDKLWGFVFGLDTTMAKTDPEAWRRIAAETRGAFDHAGNHYIFRTVQPAVAHIAADGRLTTLHASGAKWKIVSTVPEVSLGDLWQIEGLPVVIGGLLVIAIVCLGWSRAAVARREAEETKEQAEEELVRVERLASLGSLVAGVAHELNTPLGNAVTVASTLADQAARFGAEVESGKIKRSTLETFQKDVLDGTTIMLRGLQHAAELIQNFKQVAVDQTSAQRRGFRVADLVRDVVGAVGPQFKHGSVTIETAIDSKAELDSYPGPLGQVLMNLANNARIHAFDEGAVGKVTIAARDLESEEIEISVGDTGKGLPEELLEKIFDPFFTTRMGKGGTGLGLSIVFNIVTNVLGGSVWAESQLGKGTTVILHIPVSAPADDSHDPGRTYDVGQK